MTSTNAAHGQRTAAFVELGAVAGFGATLAFVYVPRYLAREGYYEHTDSLLWVSILLVPLGALIGAVITVLRPSALRGRSRARTAVNLAACVVALWLVWELWSVGTGALGLL